MSSCGASAGLSGKISNQRTEALLSSGQEPTQPQGLRGAWDRDLSWCKQFSFTYLQATRELYSLSLCGPPTCRQHYWVGSCQGWSSLGITSHPLLQSIPAVSNFSISQTETFQMPCLLKSLNTVPSDVSSADVQVAGAPQWGHFSPLKGVVPASGRALLAAAAIFIPHPSGFPPHYRAAPSICLGRVFAVLLNTLLSLPVPSPPEHFLALSSHNAQNRTSACYAIVLAPAPATFILHQDQGLLSPQWSGWAQMWVRACHSCSRPSGGGFSLGMKSHLYCSLCVHDTLKAVPVVILELILTLLGFLPRYHPIRGIPDKESVGTEAHWVEGMCPWPSPQHLKQSWHMSGIE